jgi:hypothetical protein
MAEWKNPVGTKGSPSYLSASAGIEGDLFEDQTWPKVSEMILRRETDLSTHNASLPTFCHSLEEDLGSES